MYARVARFKVAPEKIDEAIDETKRQFGELTGPPGFAGHFLFVDRASGKAMVITLWNSEQDMQVSEEKANQLMAVGAHRLDTETGEVEKYEVAGQSAKFAEAGR